MKAPCFIRTLLVLGLTLLTVTPLVAPLTAVQAQQGTVARSFHAVTAGGVPLESLALLGPPQYMNVIPPGNSANYNGHPITHGLQLDVKARGAFRLGGHYSRLCGNVYLDDKHGQYYPTIGIYDISSITPDVWVPADSFTQQPDARVIFSYTFAQNHTTGSFCADVRGIKLIGLNGDGYYCCTDLVATLYSGPSVTVFSPPLTLLPRANETIGGNALPFTWKAVPQATFYYMQIWLTRLAAGQSIGPHSVATFAARVTQTSYQLDTTLYPKGVYHWRIAASTGTSISGWTTENTVTLQ